MRLKSTVDDTEQGKDEAEDFVVCMTAEKFRVLHHGKLYIFEFRPMWVIDML